MIPDEVSDGAETIRLWPAGVSAESQAPASPPDERVEMNLAAETQAVLRSLAERQGTTMTEIIRRGIGVMQFLDREMKQGDRLLIEGSTGQMRLVVLPWKP